MFEDKIIKISKDGKVYVWNTENVEPEIYREREFLSMLKASIKSKWRPVENETFYTPFIQVEESNRWDEYVWYSNNEDCLFLLEQNLVFKTKEEAIKATNRLLGL